MSSRVPATQQTLRRAPCPLNTTTGPREGIKKAPIVWEPTFTYHGFRYVEITGMEPRMGE
jgi:hypothetical protein